jgi:PAS domain S-box-containing protein
MTSLLSAFLHSSQTQPKTRYVWLRFVLPLLLILVLIAGLGAMAYQYLSGEIRRETQRTLTVISEQKRQHIEEQMVGTRVDAHLYFGSQSELKLQFGRWLLGGHRENDEALQWMRPRLQEISQARGWSGVAMLSANGDAAIVVGDASYGEHAALIQDILRRPRIEFVDLHRPAGSDQVYFGLLAPIGEKGSAPMGVVYLTWKAEQALYPLVGSWPVPTKSAETYLVRNDAAGVRFVTPLRFRHGDALTLTLPADTPHMPAARALRGERGIIADGRDYRGKPVLAYASAVQGTPWLMLTEIDEQEAYAGIHTLIWAMALVMGLLLMLLYSAGHLFWRRERQRQELASLQARQASEARFRVVFEQAPLGVALVDASSGHVIEANQHFADIVGLPPEEMAGLESSRVTYPEDLPASIEKLTQVATGEITGYRLNKRYLRPDGSVVWASVVCAPLMVEGEQAPRQLCLIEDITARRQMEEQLQQAMATADAANVSKSEFLAHMSHEIRTPMNAVLGLAQVLARDTLTDNQKDMVRRIRNAGQSLLAILNDVLDLSKIEAGQLRIEPRVFDLKSPLASLDSLMGQAALAKGLALHIAAPEETLVPLRGDGLRLEQVLLNLTSNAIKFTERGVVTVQVRQVASDATSVRLRFEVRDCGIGIAPEALTRLFAPFAQADVGISRRFGGTGLGLSISKRLVELMGGEIGAESVVGQGSKFWFELPFQRATADELDAQPAVSTTIPVEPRLQGVHVMVVDDSAMNRDLVERALALEGASVTLAADGQQAIELLRTRPDGFDAVMMDVQMPVMDGLTATSLIRDEMGLTELPIIAFTAGVLAEQQRAALAAGANDLLPKPMDLEQMATLLLKWVQPLQPDRSKPVEVRAAGTALDDEFPDIPGIDRWAAAKRLGRNRDMFISLLQMFIEDNHDVAERTRDDLASGDRESASRRMHKLVSNAGFICALNMMRSASALEEAIKRGDSALDDRLATLGRDIRQLIEDSADLALAPQPGDAVD